MKNTHKKIIGGLLGGLLIATIGAVIATGQTDDTSEDQTNEMFPQRPFKEPRGMNGNGPFGSELTDEQQTELEDLMASLRIQNSTPDEIRAAIEAKLDEFGVFDIQLDNEIAHTEQQLTILNRKRELRQEGYSWEEIRNIIQDEFDLENTTGMGWGLMDNHGCGHGSCRGPREWMIPEETDQ